MIRSVEMYDTPNAMVQFASENTKKKMWRLKFRSSLALFAVKFFGFRTQREGGERGTGSSSPWFRAEVFLSSHLELGSRGTQLIQSSTCHINNQKSLLCRSFIQGSEVSFWPSGTLLRGWCKTRHETTKHRDHSYCSLCFKWNLALLRSSELTSLRSEMSCLPQKTSIAQAVVAQASMECLSKSSSPLTQRDAPQEHGAVFLHPPLLPSFKVSSAKNQRSFQTLLNNVPTTHKRSTDLGEEVEKVPLFISWKWSTHHLLLPTVPALSIDLAGHSKSGGTWSYWHTDWREIEWESWHLSCCCFSLFVAHAGWECWLEHGVNNTKVMGPHMGHSL